MEFEEASEAGKDDFEASIAIVNDCRPRLSGTHVKGELETCVRKEDLINSLFPTLFFFFLSFLSFCGVEQRVNFAPSNGENPE